MRRIVGSGIAFTVLLLLACSSEDPGPPVKGGPKGSRSSSGSPGATTGDGGANIADGGESNGDGGGDGTGDIAPDSLAACYDLCDYEVSLANDCPPDAGDQCKALCRLVLRNFDAQCQATAKTWAECMKREIDPATVKCGGSNVPAPQAPAGCEAETNAYVACQSGQ